MDPQSHIDRIYAHVEEGAVDKAVFDCIRLARSTGDVFGLLVFLREVSADKKQFASVFYDETRNLKEDARKFLWERSLDHWIEGRTVEGYSAGTEDEEEENVLVSGVGELQRELGHFEQCIKDIELPSGMGEFDTAAFADRYVSLKARLRRRIQANQTVLERVRTRCFNYASRIERQLAAQARNVHFLTEVQATVNNFFAARSEDAHAKLLKATVLAEAKGTEDQALLLTSVRRAIRAVADCLYPPVDGEVVCSDGKTRRLGREQYLNRLQEFCMRRLSNSTSDAMVKEELQCLSSFVRRLNHVASKGVHGEVSRSEAKQGLIGMYMFLSNIINKIETKTSNETGSGDE